MLNWCLICWYQPIIVVISVMTWIAFKMCNTNDIETGAMDATAHSNHTQSNYNTICSILWLIRWLILLFHDKTIRKLSQPLELMVIMVLALWLAGNYWTIAYDQTMLQSISAAMEYFTTTINSISWVFFCSFNVFAWIWPKKKREKVGVGWESAIFDRVRTIIEGFYDINSSFICNSNINNVKKSWFNRCLCDKTIISSTFDSKKVTNSISLAAPTKNVFLQNINVRNMIIIDPKCKLNFAIVFLFWMMDEILTVII